MDLWPDVERRLRESLTELKCVQRISGIPNLTIRELWHLVLEAGQEMARSLICPLTHDTLPIVYEYVRSNLQRLVYIDPVLVAWISTGFLKTTERREQQVFWTVVSCLCL